MPFDTTAARKIIHSLQAHRMQPGGDLMMQAAESLESALGDATNAMSQIRTAEASSFESRNKLDSCLLEIKSLRETNAVGLQAVEVLIKVAEAKKGGQAIARDWLLSVGRMPLKAVEAKA